MDFKDYMKSVRLQLDCNADDDYKKNFITYNISNELVDENIEYFRKCCDDSLSPYKALLFFTDYLNEIKNT